MGDNCTWYELNDLDGCPEYGDYPGTGDTGNATAGEACCVCGGGSTSVACFDLEGWIGKVTFVLLLQ